MPYGVVHPLAAANMASSYCTSGDFPADACPTDAASAATIALSSNHSDDRRIIELLPGQVCKIGRSSKSELKNMRASPNNALFDCAVVSRNHAELRAGREVNIIDRNSLHGTTVNGRRLTPGETFSLKTGDVIKLGDTVSRGPDTHDGVSLTFRRIDDLITRRRPSPVGSNAFHVPSDSDVSDIESDVESVLSVPQQRSSAKTTPEQPKMKLGTQESPINIDTDPSKPVSIINLIRDNEDDDMYEPPALIQKPDALHIVPDSVAFGTQYPTPGSSRALLPYPPDVRSDSGESVHRHNTDLSQILNEADDFSAHDDQLLDSEVDEDDFDYDRPDMDEDEDDLAVSPAVSAIDSEADDEYDDLFDTRPDRQPSVGLGMTDEPLRESIASKPRYDPVRSSQPPTDMVENTTTVTQSPAKGPSTYTYGPPAFQNMFMNPATNFTNSSRWDIPPAAPLVPNVFPGSPFDFTNYTPLPPASYGAALVGSQPAQSNLGYGTFGAPEHDVVPFDSAAEVAQDPPAVAQPSKDSVAKGKVSIDSMLAPTKSAQDGEHALTFRGETAQEQVTITEEGLVYQRGASKRKADEMEAGETTEPATKKAATADASTSPRQSHSDAHTRTRERSTARNITSTIARYTGVVALGAFGGAAATVAFLNSDLAPEVMSWYF